LKGSTPRHRWTLLNSSNIMAIMDDDPPTADELGPQESRSLNPQGLNDEDRIMIVELVSGDLQVGTGWRSDQMKLADPEYEFWERVLREGPRTRIVERIVRAPSEPPPSGPDWERRTNVGDWRERVLRDSPADEEDKWSPHNEPSEDDRTIARASPGSSVAHPITGNSLRALITIGVTAAVVVVVVLGIALRVPTDQYSAYMAPLLVLAGTVLGYWFGSEKS